MDDSDVEIDNQDFQDDDSKEEMEVELDNNTDCNQNISHDTSATLVSSEEEEEEENQNLAEGAGALENNPELETENQDLAENYQDEEGHSENERQELNSSSSSSASEEGSSRRRRVKPSLSAEVEVVKYFKTYVVPYKPSCQPNPSSSSLERRVVRAARPFRPRGDSQSSKQSVDSGRLSEASSCTSSSQSSSQTYRVSGRFECPGDTEDEAEAKTQLEHKDDPCRLHDKNKREILLHIFGSQFRFRGQDRVSKMINSEDSDVGRAETPCDCPPGDAKDAGECCSSRSKDESYGATGHGSSGLESATGSGRGRKRYKSDNDEEQEVQEEDEEEQKEEQAEESEFTETESDDGVDYDKKNDYNDYAYNLSCLEDTDD
ncbi:hepatoma-derived growth factor-related protein 2-like [Palaemon carinicauda]|uniref:hepatoma-derived growth factor-related protein 2-like n=1 Tax=Palaemon carinicauda TaxID=392227 RepID=UPI0035B5E0EA